MNYDNVISMKQGIVIAAPVVATRNRVAKGI